MARTILSAVRSGDRTLPVAWEPVSYWIRLARRSLSGVWTCVLHCTELPDLAEARRYAEKVCYSSGTGNCAHFYIDRDGSLHQFVPLDRTAHHVARWNRRSVGIELVNLGRFPLWFHPDHQEMTEPYTEAQYVSLLALLGELERRLGPLKIVGHAALDRRVLVSHGQLVRRRLDPGPQFDWERVRRWSRRRVGTRRSRGYRWKPEVRHE